MRFIIRFVNRFLKTEQKPIGRWYRDSCENRISRKVDLTNEDHCGPCGQYIIQEIPNKKITNTIVKSTGNLK